jgi:D-3-phosphoglycerate dehydrogenase
VEVETVKVLVADKFEKSGLDALTASGFDVVYEPTLDDEALVMAIWQHAAEVLVVRSTRVNAKMLTESPISLVVRAGAGFDTIDVETASKNGIFVCNCPGKNSVAVAELTFALILALDRFVPDNVQQFREGKWNKAGFSKARGVKGRTLGIIGLGNIGQEVAHRAKAFDMNVITWTRWLTPDVAEEMGIGLKASIEEVAEAADILTIHLAQTPETKGIINEKVFSRMKDGAYFINAARAGIVDQDAMVKYAQEKKLLVGLDVFDGEPSFKEGEFSSPLAGLSNVYVTHHIGASTQQAQEAIAEETVHIIKQYEATGRPVNMVNVRTGPPATHLLVVRHRDRVGVLAYVLEELKKADINVQEMENIILHEQGAAIAYISLSTKPSAETLEGLKYGSEDVISVVLRELEQEAQPAAKR